MSSSLYKLANRVRWYSAPFASVFSAAKLDVHLLFANLGRSDLSNGRHGFRLPVVLLKFMVRLLGFGLVYWGLTPQQQPGSYQGSEMMMMKSGFW